MRGSGTERDGGAVIVTERLTKYYGRQRGIEEISLTVRRGEVFGFLGPNGAGKTTTIRTLLDLLHPSAGQARLFGLDSRRDSVAIRARLGNLPGDFDYDRSLTGRELIAYLADLRGLDGEGRAAELAARLDVDLERPLAQLSRGNRQKVGLIQAMFHEPELLILDEPTSGLDPLMQEEFLAMVGEERARGCTLLLSSHELDEVERVCDRVGIIRDGLLIAVEEVAGLMRKAYRNVSLEFAEPIDPDEFARLPGVVGLESDGRSVRFRAEGELDAVIKAAAAHRLTDIELAHPTLEELFLSYYGRGEA